MAHLEECQLAHKPHQDQVTHILPSPDFDWSLLYMSPLPETKARDESEWTEGQMRY